MVPLVNDDEGNGRFETQFDIGTYVDVRKHGLWWRRSIRRTSGSSSSRTVVNCPSETPPEESHLFCASAKGVERPTAVEQDALWILSRCVSVLFQNVLSFSQSWVCLGMLEDGPYS